MQFNYPSLDLTDQRVKPTSYKNNITKNVIDLIVLKHIIYKLTKLFLTKTLYSIISFDNFQHKWQYINWIHFSPRVTSLGRQAH